MDRVAVSGTADLSSILSSRTNLGGRSRKCQFDSGQRYYKALASGPDPEVGGSNPLRDAN